MILCFHSHGRGCFKPSSGSVKYMTPEAFNTNTNLFLIISPLCSPIHQESLRNSTFNTHISANITIALLCDYKRKIHQTSKHFKHVLLNSYSKQQLRAILNLDGWYPVDRAFNTGEMTTQWLRLIQYKKVACYRNAFWMFLRGEGKEKKNITSIYNKTIILNICPIKSSSLWI